MIEGILWFFQQLLLGFVNVVRAILTIPSWMDWINGIGTPEAKASLMRFVYYGGSVEFFFAMLALFGTVTAVGMWRRQILWFAVRQLEAFANNVGRLAAWAGLLMVLQQTLIVFLQRIFRASEITVSPFGLAFTQDLSWYSEELKFYNALVVALCVSWTFVQGGHVRVDLIYAAVSHRARRVMDMAGCVLLMLPVAVITWMYAWFFMWRHLIVPNPSASNTLEQLEMRSRALRWNVETIGFSPNGFNGYFLFKVLLVAFAGLVFLQAWAFFWRSWLEYVGGEEDEGLFLDRDSLGDDVAERAAEIH